MDSALQYYSAHHAREEWKERAILVEAAVIWVSVYVQHSIKILLELSIVLSMKGK